MTKRSAIAITITLISLLMIACSNQDQNLTKQQLLKVANDVDEIKIQAIEYPYARRNSEPAYELRLEHQYLKGDPGFKQVLDALKDSADEGDIAPAISDRRIILRGADKTLMKFVGHAEAGQFIWLVEGVARDDHIFLPSASRKFIE